MRDLNRLSSSCGLLVIVRLTFVDLAVVGVGTVQFSLTGPDERNIAVDETTIFPTGFSGVGRKDGPILLENEK